MKDNNIKFIYILLLILTVLNIVTMSRISQFNSGIKYIMTTIGTVMEEQKKLALSALLYRSNSNNSDNIAATSSNNSLSDYGIAVLNDEIKKAVKSALEEIKMNSETMVFDDTSDQKKDSPEAGRMREKNFNNAQEIIETAIINGTWSHKDNMSIIEHMTTLSIEQQASLRKKLARAINTRKITMTEEPMF